MRVYELAKELEIPTNDIVELISEDEKKISPMANLTDEQIEFVRSEIDNLKEIQMKEELQKKKDSEYKPDDMISCRSLFPGVLLFTGVHTGMTYKFVGVGDRRHIEYQDLKGGLLEGSGVLFNPDIIIEDATLLEDEHWFDLKEVYENMYDEKDIEYVMTLPSNQFEDAFVRLPVTARQAIITQIATQIENGTFEQYNKAKIVDKICGTRFDLKMA